MLETYRLIWGLFDSGERRRFVILILLSVVMAVFEVAGVAIILPFLGVMGQPELIQTNPILSTFARVLGLESDQSVMIALGLVVLGVILLGMVVRTVVTYAQIRFGMFRAYSISSRLLGGYLAQDYVWFLSRHSADLTTALLSEVERVFRESVLPAIQILSNIFVILLIAGLLFVVEPGVAIGACLLLGGVYTIIYLVLRKPLTRLGELHAKAHRSSHHVVQELSGGIKELKLMGLENASLERFRAPARELARYQTFGMMAGGCRASRSRR